MPTDQPAAVESITTPQSPEELAARNLLQKLSKGDWQQAAAMFSESPTNPTTPDSVKELWELFENIAGKFKHISSATVEKLSPGAVVHLTCTFENTEKIIRVLLNENNEVEVLYYAPSAPLLERRTRSLIEKAFDNDYTGASEFFDSDMREALTHTKFLAIWVSLRLEAGAFETIEKVELKQHEEFWISLATTKFAKKRIIIKVVYNSRDQVSGLFFLPTETPWEPPNYAKMGDIAEEDAAVGENPALPGTLTLPVGDSTAGTAIPGVVLIHGSGPADRDETVGGTKVFKDIAAGLATRGIAVLRYDKRTLYAPSGVVTEKEEVLDGASAAIKLLRAHPRVDSNRIFVLGHSQGGNLAPRIAKENPGVAGIITLAGQTRPIAELFLEQTLHFVALEPLNPALLVQVAKARQFKKQCENPDLRPDDVLEAPGGGEITGAYFLYQRGYDAPATALSLGIPVLVLQGERDYQVTMKDFDGWKRGLNQSSVATFITYPSLNHLLVSGKGKSTPVEYEQIGHVDEKVVSDIANWVLSVPRRVP
ncbi:MAG: alpha/beta fold hydrolase [Polyangiaceae bacterium]|nr:alpha/beta fold hydrolase [Polyangiaceae bacterium]